MYARSERMNKILYAKYDIVRPWNSAGGNRGDPSSIKRWVVGDTLSGVLRMFSDWWHWSHETMAGVTARLARCLRRPLSPSDRSLSSSAWHSIYSELGKHIKYFTICMYLQWWIQRSAVSILTSIIITMILI